MSRGILAGDAKIMIEPGFILFCTESGQWVKIQANCLGDGIKRIVSFFKELKEGIENEEGLMTWYLQKLLDKHKINVEALK